MPVFELTQLIKDVDIKTLDTGDKQGTIVLRTVRPEDCQALLLVSLKTIVKVTYEYPDSDGPTETESEAGYGDQEDSD